MGVSRRDGAGRASDDPEPGGLEIEVVDWRAGAVLCRPRGVIDLATSDELGAVLDAALASRPSRLIVDLWNVGFFDSSGLNLLLRLRLDAKTAGVPLTLVSPSPAVERVLEITGAGAAFTIQASA